MSPLLIMGGVAGAGKSFLAKAIEELSPSSYLVKKYTNRPPRVIKGEVETRTDLQFSCGANYRVQCDYKYQSAQHWYGIKKCDIDSALNNNDIAVVVVRSASVIREIKSDFKGSSAIYVYPTTFDGQKPAFSENLSGRSINPGEQFKVREREFQDFITHYEYFDHVIINTFDSEHFIEQISKILLNQNKHEVFILRKNVFISHGHSPQWYKLKEFISEKAGYSVDYFEKKDLIGEHIVDILSRFLNNAKKAIILLTRDDEQKDGTTRARQNVVHEAGLFQGRLGFKNVALVFEEGVEEFSNTYGLQQIRFPAENISACFHEIQSFISKK